MPQADLSQGLFTDLYQITMAQAYWESGRTARATFSLSFRKYPLNRGYLVFAGLQDALAYLEGLRFSRDDIEYLRSTGRFKGDFLDHLGRLRFTGSVRAMSEGAIFFVDEPVIEVTGPVMEAQLVETFLLNQINLQSVLATKASRVVHAGAGRTVVDFAARRTHGTDAANKLARVGYLVGFAGTSNVMAGALYGIPTFGTMAHSFVTTFEDEADSFRAYADSFPDASTFLVDTYDTLEGTVKAAQVAREMKARGEALRAIRLDSGNLLDLSRKARAILDDAGLTDVQVFASGGLDEHQVQALVARGAPIDGFGVGTKVGVSADAPWADCAYKLVEYDGRPVLKLSPEKQMLPGPKQVYRYRDEEGMYAGDVIARAGERVPSSEPERLLTEVMKDGKPAACASGLAALRARFASEFDRLPDEFKTLTSPARYRVRVSEDLERLQSKVAHRARERSADARAAEGR
jgi:nicotinate phosphoribosyltransferase